MRNNNNTDGESERLTFSTEKLAKIRQLPTVNMRANFCGAMTTYKKVETPGLDTNKITKQSFFEGVKFQKSQKFQVTIYRNRQRSVGTFLVRLSRRPTRRRTSTTIGRNVRANIMHIQPAANNMMNFPIMSRVDAIP